MNHRNQRSHRLIHACARVTRRAPFIALYTMLSVSAYAASTTPASKDSASQDGAKNDQMSEIIVTAEKREERLMDVPVPVTVLSPETLVQSNQTKLQDYFSNVPGLNLTPGIQGV